MVKYCMLKTRAGTAPGVVEQIRIYSDGQTYMTALYQRVLMSICFCVPVLALSSAAATHCGRAFKMAFTSSATAVSANSNWSWWGRAGEREANVRESSVRGMVGDRAEGDSWINRAQSNGTLVRTRPGLWSLMCSSEAAMSISFTPNKHDKWKVHNSALYVLSQCKQTMWITETTEKIFYAILEMLALHITATLWNNPHKWCMMVQMSLKQNYFTTL